MIAPIKFIFTKKKIKPNN